MTLILTLIMPALVLQVSDRRATQGTATFDEFANKNVVFLAENALVTMGYSGQAFLDGVSTDHWIAEQIVDRVLEQQFGMQVSSGPAVRVDDIGKVVERIRSRLVTEFSKRGAPRDKQELVVAGLQWKSSRRRSRVRPVVAHISNLSLGGGAFEASYLPRNAFLPNQDTRSPICLIPIPQGYLFGDDLKKLIDDMTAHSWNVDEFERIMVHAIMAVASNYTAVGRDCMSIMVYNSGGPRIRLRYLPLFEYKQPVQLGVQQVELPAAFTPWFVARGFVQQPQVIIGGSGEWTMAGVPALIEAPPIPPNPYLTMAVLSQPRRRDPRIPRKPDRSPPPWARPGPP